MKNLKSMFLSLAITAIIVLMQIAVAKPEVAFASYMSGNYSYDVNSDNTVTITTYTGQESNIVIPSVISGRVVTGISNNAFERRLMATNITIPSSVTSIGAGAFYNCCNLTNITIPNSVTSIGNNAFLSCSKLNSIKFLGNAPTLDGNNTFDGCDIDFKIYYIYGKTGFDNWAYIKNPIYSDFSTVYSDFSTVVSASPTSIIAIWNAVTEASGYEVYRATSSTGTYNLINSTTYLGYIDTGLTTGNTYYYKIRAYKLVGTTKVYSDFSPIIFAKTY